MTKQEKSELDAQICALAKKLKEEDPDKDLPEIFFLTKAADEILFPPPSPEQLALQERLRFETPCTLRPKSEEGFACTFPYRYAPGSE